MEALFEELADGEAETRMDSQVTADSAPRLESSPVPPNSIPRSPPRSPLHPPSSMPNRFPGPDSIRAPTLSQRLISPLAETQSGAIDTILAREVSGISETSVQIELAVCNQIRSEYASENDLTPRPHKRRCNELARAESNGPEPNASQPADRSFALAPPVRDSTARRNAYLQMIANMNDDHWSPIDLISTNTEHTTVEQEL